MVRTLEGRETHQKLMEKSAEFLREQGYDVVFQARINNGRIDVLGIKGNEKVGIECQVVPGWKMLVEKTKRYKAYLNRFIVAIPSYVKPRLQPENIEVIKFDVPRTIPKSRFGVTINARLPRSLVEFLEDMVRRGEAESLSQAVRRCVAIAKTYMVEMPPREVKSGGEKP